MQVVNGMDLLSTGFIVFFHHPLVPFPDNATWKIVHNTNPQFEHVGKVVDEDNAY